jgi:Carboxypeptidase regulatory-like domain
VIGARDGEGLPDSHVRVMPEFRLTTTDSTGRFAFRGLPQGRYQVAVFAPPGSSAISIYVSVTVGFDGLRVVAVLSAHTGDIVCISTPRQPSDER